MELEALQFNDIFKVISSYDPKTKSKSSISKDIHSKAISKPDNPLYAIGVYTHKELSKNQNLIKNIKITNHLHHTTRTNLLLKRVDLYKLKSIIDDLETIKKGVLSGK